MSERNPRAMAEGAGTAPPGAPSTHEPNGVDDDASLPAPPPSPNGDTPTALLDRAPDAATTQVPFVDPELAEEGSVPARRRDPRVSVETLLWALLIGLAIVTRFWDLGSRALHHDESLHAYYSWLYATGQNYIHDPLMHGPFLFHANALVYLLLGASDATSRYVPALFGVLLVALPYLLRGPRHLGRWGALIAAGLFLISPAMLYQSRYIRHDIYTVVGSLLLFAAILRYKEAPRPHWLVLAGGSLGFLMTNHEVVFVIAFAFTLFLWGALLWGRLRPILWLQIGAVLLAAAIFLGRHEITSEAFPAIPWQSNLRSPENFRNYALDMLTYPVIVGLLVVALLFALAAFFTLRPLRDPDDERGWLTAVFGTAPVGTLEHGIWRAWAIDRRGLGLALAVGGTIFVFLYTSLLTNLDGIGSGTFGALFYWLGQQGVERGEQPWFYYLLLMPQYELVAVVFGGLAGLVTLWRAAGVALGRRQPEPTMFIRLFLVVWFGIVFLVLSGAGEKMPWLITHVSLPATLLAASFLGELLEQALTRRRAVDRLTATSPFGFRLQARWAGVAVVAALLAVGAGWFLLAGRLTHGEFEQADGAWRRVPTDDALERWWWLAIPPAAALGVLLLSWALRGARHTGRAALAALALALVFSQIHAGWRTAYLEGDVAKDMLIYNTTSPDITRMVAELGWLSDELTGGKDMVIWYGDEVSWPLYWYLRDFPKKHYFPGGLSGPPTDVPVVVVANQHLGGVQPHMAGYTAQEYVLRWHEPEYQIYRNFAIAPELKVGRSAWKDGSQPKDLLAIASSIIDSLETQLSPEGQQRLYRLVMYREMPAPLNGFEYTVFIRNDLLPLLNGIRY